MSSIILTLTTGSGRGGGGLDHESWVKFPYIHESRYLLESFHESRV